MTFDLLFSIVGVKEIFNSAARTRQQYLKCETYKLIRLCCRSVSVNTLFFVFLPNQLVDNCTQGFTITYCACVHNIS